MNSDAFERITSLQNPRVKWARGLREREARERLAVCLLDGERELERALAAGMVVTDCFVSAAFLETSAGRRLQQRATSTSKTAAPTPVIRLASEAILEKLAYGSRHDGVVAVAQTPVRTLASLELSAKPCVLVLAGLEKPGNIGAILRTAAAAGVDAVLLTEVKADLWNPNCIRASTGAVFTVPVVSASHADTLAFLRSQRLSLIAARVEAKRPFFAANYTGGVALILGAEASGLSAAWQLPEVQEVSIPMRGNVDSLNVSVSAALLLYEVVRQRMQMVT